MKLIAAHICFEVEDYFRAIQFYGWLLGAAGFFKSWGDDAFYAGFVNYPSTIVIGATKPRRASNAAPTGDEFVVTDHVGFYAPTVQDVFDIELAMKHAGYEPLFSAREYAEFGKGFFPSHFAMPTTVQSNSHRDRKRSHNCRFRFQGISGGVWASTEGYNYQPAKVWRKRRKVKNNQPGSSRRNNYA